MTMLTQEFCDYLEYYLTATLAKSLDIDRRRCWCDGIFMHDEKEYSSERVNKTKHILTRAWIDEGRIKGKQRGQFIYDLTIIFGDKALACYKDGGDLKECLPDQNIDDWVWLDREKRKVV